MVQFADHHFIALVGAITLDCSRNDIGDRCQQGYIVGIELSALPRMNANDTIAMAVRARDLCRDPADDAMFVQQCCAGEPRF